MPLRELSVSDAAKVAKQELFFDTRSVSQILAALKPVTEPLPPEEARITVHAAVSRISVLYERIRNAVEYREEHLLRKWAILRILRRQFILEGDPVMIAHNLIRELIAALYLPNETLPESLVEDVAWIVRKYQAMSAAGIASGKTMQWVMGIVAAEIEEVVAPPRVEKALVTFLYQKLSDRIYVKGSNMDDAERRLQIFTACFRTFVKADEEQVAYKLVRAYVPEWVRPSEWIDDPMAVAEKLIGARTRIFAYLHSPLTQRFIRAVRPWSVSLWMLREAVEQETERGALLSSRSDTHSAVEGITAKREQQARGKVLRGTIRAMIYLLITKIVFALAIEVPAEYYLYGSFSKFALGVNIALPPTVMLVVGIFIKRPGMSNRKRILEHVDGLLMAEGPTRYDIRMPRKRSAGSAFVFGLLYLAMFCITFGLIGQQLLRLEFTPVAITVFFFFLCLVSFFGYRLRLAAREIIVVKPREHLLNAIGDFLALPLLRAGRWLSNSISRINVFAFILDVVFEAPLKIFLGALEESLRFIREKKEELSDE
ncbi:MAG: hypothetical protein WC477_01835 [Patescibacteria group bacterium]